MKITITDKYKEVIPDDGYSLVNGDVISKCIYTPLSDDLSSWDEVPDILLPDSSLSD